MAITKFLNKTNRDAVTERRKYWKNGARERKVPIHKKESK
jgi:hypothetical protein